MLYFVFLGTRQASGIVMVWLLRSVNDSFVFYSSLIPSTTKLPVTSCVKFKYS